MSTSKPHRGAAIFISRGFRLPDPPTRLADLDPEARAWITENDRYVQAGAGRSRRMRLCMATQEDGRPCAKNVASVRKNFCRGHQKEHSGSIPPRAGGHVGQENWRRQFTTQQVKKIRDQYADGNITIRALGEKWGASEGVISHVVNYRTYRQGTRFDPRHKEW